MWRGLKLGNDICQNKNLVINVDLTVLSKRGTFIVKHQLFKLQLLITNSCCYTYFGALLYIQYATPEKMIFGVHAASNG